jgi:hypothetical protein
MCLPRLAVWLLRLAVWLLRRVRLLRRVTRLPGLTRSRAAPVM